MIRERRHRKLSRKDTMRSRQSLLENRWRNPPAWMAWLASNPLSRSSAPSGRKVSAWRKRSHSPVACFAPAFICSKRYPSRLESRAGFFASTRDGGLSPRVCLECNPEIPVAPGEEHWLLDTSLDEVYWPCSHSRAIPSFPSQLEWKIGLAWANTRGSLNSPS